MRDYPFLLLSALTLLLSPSIGRAEGSCTWSDVTPILDSQPALRRFLEESFTLSPGGSAMRLGKEFDSLDGRRVGPYRFDATSRRDPSLLLELVIETQPEFIDEAGHLLPPGKEAAAIVVRERFKAIRLEPVLEESTSPTEILPAAQADERIAWTQARCNQLHLADHQIRTLDFPANGPVTGKAIYHHDAKTNALDYFTVDAVSGGNSISESFYFNQGELIFVLRRHASAPPAQTGFEMRYYLQNGQIFKATRKPAPSGTMNNAAAEEPVPVSPEDSNHLLVRVSRLAFAAEAAQVAADYSAMLAPAP